MLRYFRYLLIAVILLLLLTVALALFTAFPMFSAFQGALEKYFLKSLVPDNIARQVLGYLTQFSSKASRRAWLIAMPSGNWCEGVT